MFYKNGEALTESEKKLLKCILSVIELRSIYHKNEGYLKSDLLEEHLFTILVEYGVGEWSSSGFEDGYREYLKITDEEFKTR